MAETVLRVTVPDDDEFIHHYGVKSWVQGLVEMIESDRGNSVTVDASVGPAGHACSCCGGATHDSDCSPGEPPEGVPYLECCVG